MSIEREAVKYSEPWRAAFREYLLEMIRNADKFTSVSGEVAEGLADMEFGIYEKPTPPTELN